MHILHVTFMFPTPAKPLEGVAIEDIVRGLKESIPGSKHTVLHLSAEAAEELDGMEDKDYTYYNLRPPFYYKFIQYFSNQKIKPLLENNNFDLIHFHNVFPGILLLGNYAIKEKIPYIITFRAHAPGQ